MQGLVVALLLLGLYIAAKSLISAGKFLISQIGAVSWEHYARKLFTRGENTR